MPSGTFRTATSSPALRLLDVCGVCRSVPTLVPCYRKLLPLPDSYYGNGVSLEIPLDRRRRRTHTAVLDAAERLFARHGYRGTTIEALADEADVAVSSIYSNFAGGKPDVYAALAWRIAQRHAEQMRRGGSGVLAHFDNYVAFHHDNPLAVRMLTLYDVASEDSELVLKARAQIEALLGSVVQRVTAAVAESDCDTDPRALVLYVWASVNGMFSLRQRGAVDDAMLRQMLAIARRDLGLHFRGGDDERG